MARQVINIGTNVDDGTGDPLRTAMDKVNDNFAELYTNVGGLDVAVGDFDFTNSTMSTTVTNGNIILDPNGTGVVQINSDVTVSGTLSATTITGSFTGNAATASALQTARNINLTGDLTGSASFDGSSDININATVQVNSIALGIDTTGNYVASATTSGLGISGSVSTEGGLFTVTSNATQNSTPNTIVFRDSGGDFSAGTITATAFVGDGSGLTGISIPDTGDITFSANTISTTGTNQNLILDPNGTGSVVVDNLNISGNTISSTNTNGNIILNTNGTGNVGINATNPAAVLHIDETSSDTKLFLTTGNPSVIPTVNAGLNDIVIDNLSSPGRAAGITILSSSTTTSGIAFDDGSVDGFTGGIIYDHTTDQMEFYTGPDTTANLVFSAGASGVDINNINIVNNTISSTDTNGNIVLDPNGTGVVSVVGTVSANTYVGDVQQITGPGTVNTITLVTEITTTGTDAFTLANGVLGQLKYIVAANVAAGNATLTPTTFANGTTITFNSANDAVQLLYMTNGWTVISNSGAAIA